MPGNRLRTSTHRAALPAPAAVSSPNPAHLPVTRALAILVGALMLVHALSPVMAGTAAGIEAFEAGDYEKAFEELKPKAESGDVQAQYYLGGMYWQGSHVQKDLRRARYWIEKASQGGYEPANLELGYMYSNGIGVKADNKKAVELYRNAAVAGDPIARRNLGLMYKNGEGVPGDYGKAVEWFERAAAQGDAVAAREIGEIHYYGHGDFALDYREAIRWFHRAARAGDGRAQYALYGLYLQGLGVAADNEIALTWALFAAEQGYPRGEQAWENADRFISEEQRIAIRERVRRGDMPAIDFD